MAGPSKERSLGSATGEGGGGSRTMKGKLGRDEASKGEAELGQRPTEHRIYRITGFRKSVKRTRCTELKRTVVLGKQAASLRQLVMAMKAPD
ncbi:hypothetical protein GUJ93_ZPchr0003g18048 [Zizania palustris]|uniref:Uncharacterized protein n=1 Tax=Zizania palustris TaxID=103762 RepID=A0A8J5VVF1_ZIZPA|nr:hypothetical protein GUJ93_ZPchr0003g18048 [Zizania palustris]